MNKTIWIDIDNAPHVQIFYAVIKELASEHTVLITAKDYGQTLDLLKFRNIEYSLIGKHPGKHLLKKVIGSLLRAFKLILWARNKNIDIGVSHGSRAMIIACWMLGIRSMVLFDYEHVERFLITKLATHLYVPSYLGKQYLIQIGFPKKKLFEYPGLKENIYLPFFKPDPSMIARLKLDLNKIIIVIRPPSEISHYNAHLKYDHFDELLAQLTRCELVRILFLPRYQSQIETYKSFCDNKNITIIDKVEDGLNLIYYSDLVISGGGTMNREAAAMNVPVYTFFIGKKPRVDINLEKEGKLVFINNTQDIRKIRIEKRTQSALGNADRTTFNTVVKFIKDKTNTKYS